MIWRCVTFSNLGTITIADNTNAREYIEIIVEDLWPVVAGRFLRNNYIFQDVNAHIHKARIIQNFKLENNIHSMDWPAQSWDLNIIEKLLLRRERELQYCHNTIPSNNELETVIRQVWLNIPVNYIQSLNISFHKWIQRVSKSKGYITKY